MLLKEAVGSVNGAKNDKSWGINNTDYYQGINRTRDWTMGIYVYVIRMNRPLQSLPCACLAHKRKPYTFFVTVLFVK